MAENDTQQNSQREFVIQRIFTKDISFEIPNSPAVFQMEWKPESSLNLSTKTHQLAEGTFEVELTVTVTTKLQDKTAYLVEVKQGGIFTVQGFGDQELGHMLGAFCPNVLFPYAREVVSDLVGKGSFPQMALAPVNFDVLYLQSQKHLAEQQAGSGSTS